MNLLLDTCTFIWAAAAPAHLSPAARRLVTEPGNTVYFSSVSAWEIAVKYGLGRLALPVPPDRFVPAQRAAHGFDPLPLDEETVLHVVRLPVLHRDPFDRMLVCQAIVHGLVILTPDPLVEQYPARVVW